METNQIPFSLRVHSLISSLVVMVFMTVGCSPKITETGIASYYADKFEGRKTASDVVFRQNKMTAAHRSLPFGTKVKVTNLTNGNTIKVRINDRGPFVEGRIIDLSKKAAGKLQMINAGIAEVKIKYRKR